VRIRSIDLRFRGAMTANRLRRHVECFFRLIASSFAGEFAELLNLRSNRHA
jgi:hypothetical protein